MKQFAKKIQIIFVGHLKHIAFAVVIISQRGFTIDQWRQTEKSNPLVLNSNKQLKWFLFLGKFHSMKKPAQLKQPNSGKYESPASLTKLEPKFYINNLKMVGPLGFEPRTKRL